MPDPVVENINSRSVELEGGEYDDETLTFAAADTFVPGTLLARNSVSGKLEIMVVGGPNGTDVPKAVLQYTVTRGSGGDTPIRPLLKGKVNKDMLIIDADGDGSNITTTHLDQLRAAGITPVSVAQLAELDNQ